MFLDLQDETNGYVYICYFNLLRFRKQPEREWGRAVPAHETVRRIQKPHYTTPPPLPPFSLVYTYASWLGPLSSR